MWYFGIVIHRRMHHICVSLHVYQVLCHVLPVSINTKIESCLLAYPRFFLLTPPSPFLWLWLVYIMHKWDSSLLTPTLGASSCRLAMSTSIGFSFFLLLLPRLLVLCMECFYLFSVVISVTCVSATLISHIRLQTNQLIWELISPYSQTWDKKMQAIEKSVVKAAVLLCKTVNNLAKIEIFVCSYTALYYLSLWRRCIKSSKWYRGLLIFLSQHGNV